MRAQQLVQDLHSLLGGRGAAGVSGVGKQKERKEQGSMEKRNEERRPMGKDRSGGGNEESTLSTANVTIVLVKEDRKEGRVGRNHPPPSCQLCGQCTRAVQSQLGPWTVTTLCPTVDPFRCCHTLPFSRARAALVPETLFALGVVPLPTCPPPTPDHVFSPAFAPPRG